MDSWRFTSEVLRLEETNIHNPDPHLKSSEGWGYALADWLKPQLAQLGYPVTEFKPDTCGWCLDLRYERYALRLSCMVIQASSINNVAALGLGSLDLWELFCAGTPPKAEGGMLKKMFGKPDAASMQTYETHRQALIQHIAQILQNEPTIRLIAGEPDYGSDD